MNDQKHPGGRPTGYSKELGEKICHLISTDPRSIFELSQEVDWFPPSSTFFDWVNRYPEFSDLYSRAQLSQAAVRLEQAQHMINRRDMDYVKDDKGRIMSNNIWANSVRSHVNFNQWRASKLLKDKYGDSKAEEKADEAKKAVEDLKSIIEQNRDNTK